MLFDDLPPLNFCPGQFNTELWSDLDPAAPLGLQPGFEPPTFDLFKSVNESDTSAAASGTLSLQSSSTSDSVDGGEVVVIAYREMQTGTGGSSAPKWADSRVSRSPDNTATYETLPDQDVVTVSKAPGMGPLTAEQRAYIQDLLESYPQWLAYLQSLPPNQSYTMPDGRTTTAAQAAYIFSLVDLVIYPVGYDFGNGGAGYADNITGNPVLSIAIDQLGRNMATDDMTAYYFTHELAHMTGAGMGFYESMRTSGQDGNTITTDEWSLIERYANSLGDAIARSAGYTFSQTWQSSGAPGGYYGPVVIN